MNLHLITSRNDLRNLQNLLQVGDGTVGNPDSFDFSGIEEFFHEFPGFKVGP